MTPYIRTFFEKPLLDIDGQKIVALDFSKIELVATYKPHPEDHVYVVCSSGSFELETASAVAFLEVFRQYARDMQSMERSPVSFYPTIPPVAGTDTKTGAGQ